MLDEQTTLDANATQSQNGSLALRLARDGSRLFPCGPDKKPLVKWRNRATSDPDQIRKWWARWPEAMPGLPTGESNGLSVVDLDVGRGKDGLAAARAVGIEPEAADLIVRTASGGLHLYFDHAPGVMNSATKAGLDVRGEGGYVIAPGTVGKAGRYSVQKGSLAAARLLGLSPFPAALRRPERPEEAQQSAPGNHDVADLRQALSYVPNDGSYDDWVAILMALHHATGGSSDGLALALGWSAGYQGFSYREVREKWRSFGRAEGLLATADTLFAEARRHGWQAVDADDFDDLPEDEPDSDICDLLDTSPEVSEVAGLPFLTPGQCASLPARDYVVKRLIAPGQVGCIFGEPGAGKSLIAPRLAYAVAQGEEVFGLRTKQAPVTDQNGERIEYSRTTAPRLAAYIADLERQIAGQSRPAVITFQTSKGLN